MEGSTNKPTLLPLELLSQLKIERDIYTLSRCTLSTLSLYGFALGIGQGEGRVVFIRGYFIASYHNYAFNKGYFTTVLSVGQEILQTHSIQDLIYFR